MNAATGSVKGHRKCPTSREGGAGAFGGHEVEARGGETVAGRAGVDGLGEIGVSAHAVAVSADVDDVAAVQEPVEQRGGHDPVAEDPTPLFEALVGEVSTVEACS